MLKLNKLPTPQKPVLLESISACEANGKALLEDSRILFGCERYSTALALSILAQEEFAKAFLLQLVHDDALPWLPEVRQSLVKHQCKHLLAIVMEWLPPFDLEKLIEQLKRGNARHIEIMDWHKRRQARYEQGDFSPHPDDPEPAEDEFFLPREVSDALNIYRHEEIEYMKRGFADRDAEATGKARKLANGWLDQKKQRGIYVDITKTGEVGYHPGMVTRKDALEAIAQAERLSDMPVSFSDEYRRLHDLLPLIFSNLAGDEDSGETGKSG